MTLYMLVFFAAPMLTMFVYSFWRVSGDMPADFAVFARRLAGCRGLRPHLAAPVRPL